MRSHGSALLAYLIAHECTALLTDEDLELADHAAGYAVAAPMSEVCYARISKIRHLIAGMLRSRQQKPAESAQDGPRGTISPNEGPMARLIPPPLTQPPAPAYADLTTPPTFGFSGFKPAEPKPARDWSF